jgi:hypothetical protein
MPVSIFIQIKEKSLDKRLRRWIQWEERQQREEG